MIYSCEIFSYCEKGNIEISIFENYTISFLYEILVLGLWDLTTLEL